MNFEITAFITALSHATNIAKAAIQARDESVRQNALAELNGALAELQIRHLEVIQNHQTLLEQSETLRKKLAAYDKWEKEKARYTLGNLGAGSLVRLFHPDQKSREPAYWICANCYEDRQKSPLQRTKLINVYVCPKCHTEIRALKAYPK